jgi:hypothetical protein
MATLPPAYARVVRKLQNDLPRLQLLHRYATGNAPLPEGAEGCSAAYRAFQSKSRTNFAELAVTSVRERMHIGGFRTGAEDDENGDREARRLWKANDLAVKSADAHDWMLTYGRAYAIVGPVSPFTGAPVVTVEHPMQMATVHDPLDKRRVLLAVKIYRDDNEGMDYAYFYEPDRIVRYSKSAKSDDLLRYDPKTNGGLVTTGGWELIDERANPLGMTPVVVFENLNGVGEFEHHLDILDRINHTVLQRLVITTTQAFKQRALKGNIPEHDEQGNAIDLNGLFSPGPGSLWVLPEGTDIWESGQADMNGVLAAAKHDIQDFAAVTRTPLHYLTPGGESQSAEGAMLSREGLVFKTHDRIDRVTSSWATVMSLMFRYVGDDTRASLMDLEPIWESPERYSLAERGDAVAKFAAVMPFRALMSHIGQFSPAEVDEMESEKVSESLLAGLFDEEPETPTAPASAEVPGEEGQTVETFRDLSVGDVVEFDEGYGQVEHIMTAGVLGIAGSPFAIQATRQNPALQVRLWSWTNGSWVATPAIYGTTYNDVTRLDALPTQG